MFAGMPLDRLTAFGPALYAANASVTEPNCFSILRK